MLPVFNFSIRVLLSSGMMFVLLAASPLRGQEKKEDSLMTGIEYPETKKVEVQDDYHGHLVKDPFRWLEDTDSSDTQRWISDQNALTNQYLSDIPDRDSIRERLEKLWNYERFGIPTKRGDSYFFSHNDGLQNQSILYRSCLLYTSPSPRDLSTSRMPSSA